MPATGPSSPAAGRSSTPPPNAAMVYRPTSPDHESQRLMADSSSSSGRYDDHDDAGRRRRSLRLRFHLVHWLRLLVAFLSVASVCLTAGGDTLIPAAIPVFVFATLSTAWNGAILFGWAFCHERGRGRGRGRLRCLCLRLPVCLCQLGACRVGCGDDDEAGDGHGGGGDLEAAAAAEKNGLLPRLAAKALWVVDLLFAVPFLVCPAIYNAQAELFWWARYNREKLMALNFIIWPISVLFLLIAAVQHTRLGRGVTITITPDDPVHDSYRPRVRSPRRSPP
ncbi:hypothetical protein RB597_003681 [Gaeumannomyces tritici]